MSANLEWSPSMADVTSRLGLERMGWPSEQIAELDLKPEDEVVCRRMVLVGAQHVIEHRVNPGNLKEGESGPFLRALLRDGAGADGASKSMIRICWIICAFVFECGWPHFVTRISGLPCPGEA
jgi:hypothetical protein